MENQTDLDATLDMLSQRLVAVIEHGSTESTINAVLDDMSAVESQIEHKRWQADRICELIEDGYPCDEAEAEVTGESLDVVRKRNFILDARANGHKGNSFDALVTIVHRALVVDAHETAMNDCVGYMNRTNRADNGYRFWFASEATVRKHATDELLAWFEEHGRLTRTALRDSILSGRPPRTAMGGR